MKHRTRGAIAPTNFNERDLRLKELPAKLGIGRKERRATERNAQPQPRILTPARAKQLGTDLEAEVGALVQLALSGVLTKAEAGTQARRWLDGQLAS